MITFYRDDLVAENAYFVIGTGLWAYSPDGTGLYWYTSMGELIDHHGPVARVRFIDVLED